MQIYGYQPLISYVLLILNANQEKTTKCENILKISSFYLSNSNIDSNQGATIQGLPGL